MRYCWMAMARSEPWTCCEGRSRDMTVGVYGMVDEASQTSILLSVASYLCDSLHAPGRRSS